jgi:biopolymer transport protein ExbD
MRVPGVHRREGVGFNMTPMIDVVFLLIIFFLVSSHLARQEIQMELDLPDAATGHRADAEEDIRRIVINVLAEEPRQQRILVAGEALDADSLAEMVRYESRRSTKPLEVRIRSDRSVPYGVVEPIMIACARAGVWNVTFAVHENR